MKYKWMALVTTCLLVACIETDEGEGGDGRLSSTTANSGESVVTVGSCSVPTSVLEANPVGRLLAAQCAQCHGTDGVSQSGIDSLAGESRAELIAEMQEMQIGNRPDVMHLQAKGYTTEQIGFIADYFAGISGGSSGQGSNDNHNDSHNQGHDNDHDGNHNDDHDNDHDGNHNDDHDNDHDGNHNDNHDNDHDGNHNDNHDHDDDDDDDDDEGENS